MNTNTTTVSIDQASADIIINLRAQLLTDIDYLETAHTVMSTKGPLKELADFLARFLVLVNRVDDEPLLKKVIRSRQMVANMAVLGNNSWPRANQVIAETLTHLAKISYGIEV